MKRVFLDTNVLLDILLRRDPFYAPAAELWLKLESRELEGMVSLTSLGTVFYLVKRSADAKTAREALGTMSRVLQIVDSPARAGHMALESRIADFEDALQYFTAMLASADCIITRNPSDFPRTDRRKLRVLTPEEFLRTFGK